MKQKTAKQTEKVSITPMIRDNSQVSFGTMDSKSVNRKKFVKITKTDASPDISNVQLSQYQKSNSKYMTNASVNSDFNPDFSVNHKSTKIKNLPNVDDLDRGKKRVYNLYMKTPYKVVDYKLQGEYDLDPLPILNGPPLDEALIKNATRQNKHFDSIKPLRSDKINLVLATSNDHESSLEERKQNLELDERRGKTTLIASKQLRLSQTLVKYRSNLNPLPCEERGDERRDSSGSSIY